MVLSLIKIRLLNSPPPLFFKTKARGSFFKGLKPHEIVSQYFGALVTLTQPKLRDKREDSILFCKRSNPKIFHKYNQSISFVLSLQFVCLNLSMLLSCYALHFTFSYFITMASLITETLNMVATAVEILLVILSC